MLAINKNICKKSFAEFIGTFALVFSGCGAAMVSSLHPDILPSSSIPIVFGLVIAVMIYAVGHISGAHFNPAVTLAFALTKRFGKHEVLPYWFAQFAGGLAAMAILATSLPETQTLGTTIPSVGIWQALLWECILTFFLMFVIISVATDNRAIGTMAGVAIGGTVMLDAFIGGAITGASMNPARSFAPAVLSGQLQDLWIYFVAPAIGATLGAYTYEIIRCDENQKKTEVKGCC